MHFEFSPFSVPIAGLLVGAIAIIAGVISKAHTERLQSEQRLAMLARGVPAAEIERMFSPLPIHEQLQAPRAAAVNAQRSAVNMRTAGIVLVSSGLGLVLFLYLLGRIFEIRGFYAGAASGLVPLAIGVGYLVDARLRRRELAHLRDEGVVS